MDFSIEQQSRVNGHTHRSTNLNGGVSNGLYTDFQRESLPGVTSLNAKTTVPLDNLVRKRAEKSPR